MKKVFTLAACALLGLSAMAEKSFSYYAGAALINWGGAASTDASGQIAPMSLFVTLLPAQTPALTGAKITKIEMPNKYVSNMSNITAWTSTPQAVGAAIQQPDGQVVEVTTEDNTMTGTFTTPVEIPATGLSIGYTFTVKSSSSWYFEYATAPKNVPNSFYRTWSNASSPVSTVVSSTNMGVLPIVIYYEEGDSIGETPVAPQIQQTGSFSYWHGENLDQWGGGSNGGTFDAFIMIDTQNNPDLLNQKVIGITLTNSKVSQTGNIRAWASQSQVATDGSFSNLIKIEAMPTTIDGSLITGMFVEPIKITNPQTWFGFSMTGPVSGSFPIDRWNNTDNIANSMYRVWQGNIVSNSNMCSWPIVLLLGDVVTGVDEVATDNAATTYYDLMGREVAALGHGIFIKKQGTKTSKIIL